MSFIWLAVVASLIVAGAALANARRTARRLDRLAEMYWELKYQYSELRTQFEARTGAVPKARDTAAPTAPTAGIIPLTSLKR
jgi:hypothetical protein